MEYISPNGNTYEVTTEVLTYTNYHEFMNAALSLIHI